ncbi:septum formation initiator [Allobacillus halotolerans]|uniref:Septum formation initiator n=1 Tax=Allobacillus halotolerans TaxID=570278 RepID=A0ABS6GR87_9BACI|nr:septum formation initiator [Allobacillus halotolerans]MBU6081415.1 septum formation initiator [Allobacillus halotolerans]
MTNKDKEKTSLIPDMVIGVLIAIAVWLVTDNLVTGIAVGVTIGAGLNVVKEMKNRRDSD